MILSRILAVVGGGIKGYAEALWLEALCLRLGVERLSELVDLGAGTSVGALVICAVRLGMSPTEIAGLLRGSGPGIFARQPVWSWPRRTWRDGLSHPRYPAGPLAAAMRRAFGDAVLGDLPRTIVTAYRPTDPPDLDVLKSWRPRWAQMPVVDACLASSAAPSYFSGHVIGRDGWVDGGLAVNDPSACAFAEALREGAALDSIGLITLSAGDVPPAADPEDLREWGGVEWLPRLLPALMHAQLRATAYLCERLLPPERYVRVRIPLEGVDLDDASNRAFSAQERAVREHLASPQGQLELDRAAAILRPPPDLQAAA